MLGLLSFSLSDDFLALGMAKMPDDASVAKDSGMTRNVVETRDFCYSLTGENIISIEQAFRKQDLITFITAKMVDGHEKSFFNAEQFLEWSQHPRAPLKSFYFASSKDAQEYTIFLKFSRSRRLHFLNETYDSAMVWSLRGPANTMTDVDASISKILADTKQTYSILFGNRAFQSLLFDFLTLYLPIIVVLLSSVWLFMDFVHSTVSNIESRYYKMPDGRIVEAVPMLPVMPDSEPKFSQVKFWKYYGIPYMILAFLLRFLRRLYPVAMFDFGYDKAISSRRTASRDKLVWVIIGGIIAGVIATLLVNFYS